MRTRIIISSYIQSLPPTVVVVQVQDPGSLSQWAFVYFSNSTQSPFSPPSTGRLEENDIGP
jgi:hypothetical protein